MIKTITAFFAAFAFVLVGSAATQPQSIIFDTDMGNDCDDAIAQVMLFDYVKQGKAKLLCIASNKDNPCSPQLISLICQYYGFDDIPIFRVENGYEHKDGPFLRRTVEAKNPDGSLKFKLKNPDEKYEESVKGLRKVLAAQPDNSVVYISIGFFTNLARLADSPADDISPLTGAELIAKKVKYVSAMAGGFATFDIPIWNARATHVRPEYNARIDIPATKRILENPPCPIILSPFELGMNMRFPYYYVEHGFYDAPNNPAAYACKVLLQWLFERKKQTAELDRHIWDLTSVLYVFEPELFTLSGNGDVEVARNGTTVFMDSKKGKVRYMIAPEQNWKTILKRCVDLSKTTPLNVK